jgi:putative aldouronate transport system permease protein
VKNRVFDIANYVFLILFALACVYPFYYILIYSISIPSEAARGGIYLWPKGFSLEGYRRVFVMAVVARAALVSLGRTVLGTAVTVMCSSLFAYALASPRLRFRRPFYRLAVVTLYLNAGLIPWYVTMTRLGLKNNFLVYVVPSAVVVFFVILIKTYIEQIPKELDESARMDGAGPLRIFGAIVLPLCGPILATIAIFSAVNQWNAWQDNLYLVSNPKMQTLQFVLLRYLSDQTANMMAIKARTSSAMDVTVVELTPSSIRMTITMIVTLPILFVYPFFQRYFVSGIMIGAMKG